MRAILSITSLFRFKAALLAGLILLSSLPGIAQNAAPGKKRPTLGLALHNADSRPLRTRYGKAAVAQALDLVDHRVYLRLCSVVLHDDKQFAPPRRSATSPVSLLQTIDAG